MPGSMMQRKSGFPPHCPSRRGSHRRGRRRAAPYRTRPDTTPRSDRDVGCRALRLCRQDGKRRGEGSPACTVVSQACSVIHLSAARHDDQPPFPTHLRRVVDTGLKVVSEWQGRAARIAPEDLSS